jgi:alpha-1,6-mannosyltransferase
VKIVQIANFYTPTSGGLRTCIDQIGRGYGAAGHERVLIVPGRSDCDEITPAGRRVTVRSPRLLGSGSYHVLTGLRIHELLDRINPDVLEVSDKFSVAWLTGWARKRGVPLVLFSHERIDAILRTRVPRPFPLVAAANVANTRLYKRAAHVVVASQFAAAEFLRVGATNVRRVPLGVDLEVFRPADAATVNDGLPVARNNTAGPAPLRLVTVSRLSKEKRVEWAVDALRALCDDGVAAELTVIGDGPLRDALRERALGLPIRFVGHLAEPARVAELVAAADIAVCPSPAETFGLAILEALACGTPVVVPGDGAARELVIEPGSGVVTDGTPHGLAEGVRSLLAIPSPERRRAARAAAERFPWSATVDRLLEIYHDYDVPAVAG